MQGGAGEPQCPSAKRRAAERVDSYLSTLAGSGPTSLLLWPLYISPFQNTHCEVYLERLTFTLVYVYIVCLDVWLYIIFLKVPAVGRRGH